MRAAASWCASESFTRPRLPSGPRAGLNHGRALGHQRARSRAGLRCLDPAAPAPLVLAPSPGTLAEGGSMKLFDLTGRVAVVTGGNGGIGLGMARGMAEAGAAI